MKEVENLARVEESRPVGPSKQRLVARTDDGDCYEWSRFRESERWSFERRTGPDGERSTRKTRLPSDVKWCVSLVTGGVDEWQY